MTNILEQVFNMPQLVVTESYSYRALVLFDLRRALCADHDTAWEPQQPSHSELHQAETLVVGNGPQPICRAQVTRKRVALEAGYMGTLIVIGEAVAG